jgi:hypothetical protein
MFKIVQKMKKLKNMKKMAFLPIIRLFFLCMTFSVTIKSNCFAAETDTVEVSTLAELQNAINNESVGTIIVTQTITMENGTKLICHKVRKTVRVVNPFLPDTGRVRITTREEDGKTITMLSEPAEDEYSKYTLFVVPQNATVEIQNLTLMGGFASESRDVSGTPTVGGIDNYGHLKMVGVDILRTGTALLNRPKARAVLEKCNIVRNANWYGGGILNFAQESGGQYINGGTIVMDSCSLTENESLGPQHGGGAAENQGLMCLNNCIVANNASTEIGGGINNCKGGKLLVMNSTFTGNITTSADYGTLAGGAIGNAGGASHVHIVNSLFAYNGYDDGEEKEVIFSSIAKYEDKQDVHVDIVHSVYDSISGLPQIDMTGTTKEYENLLGNLENTGIVAAGAVNQEGKTSDFVHPEVADVTDSDTSKYSLQPAMLQQEENHYIFKNAVTTYFDYSEIFEGDEPVIIMAYDENGTVKKLGDVVSMPTTQDELDKTKVTTAFGEESRGNPNFIGASVVRQKEPGEVTEEILYCKVSLDPNFTGGRVSGVTVFTDSYRTNTVITVHGIPNSAYDLNGWFINGELANGSSQKYIFSFTLDRDIVIKPFFVPVVTEIKAARQRYPWNNLVDIDYTVSEKDVRDYRLVFIATYTDADTGTEKTIQLKSFVNNAGKINNGKFQEQRLGEKPDLRKSGPHRVTWDSAADGVKIKGTNLRLRLLACEGDER